MDLSIFLIIFVLIYDIITSYNNVNVVVESNEWGFVAIVSCNKEREEKIFDSSFRLVIYWNLFIVS